MKMQLSRYRGVGLIVIMLLLLVLNWQSNQKLDTYSKEIKQMKLQVEILGQEQDKLIQDYKQRVELDSKLEDFLDKWNVEVVEVTAYSPFDDRNGLNSDGNPRITSTGTKPGPGTVAVNPSVIPYGSRLWVQGYGWGVAADTGGAMRQRNDLIDVFMWTYEEAMKWGRQKALVVYERS